MKERLAKYENPKNSGNSGIAPSQNPFRKTKSLRGRSDKPQGGQKGHKGESRVLGMKMVADPDVVVLHDIAQCGRCGHGLPGEADSYDAHQVFDIPPITMHVTEHRRSHKTCADCGKHNIGDFPKRPVQEAQLWQQPEIALCIPPKLPPKARGSPLPVAGS